jgi:cobalt-zinc-cadmium efflux system outer membrane protein
MLSSAIVCATRPSQPRRAGRREARGTLAGRARGLLGLFVLLALSLIFAGAATAAGAGQAAPGSTAAPPVAGQAAPGSAAVQPAAGQPDRDAQGPLGAPVRPPAEPGRAPAPNPAEPSGSAAGPPPTDTAASAPAPNPSTADASGAATLSLQQAIELALAANRALAAARLARPIARANVAVAAERPNPDLLLEKLRETPHEAATLSLPIETAGKRQRRIDAAEAEAASGEADLARTTAGIRNRVRRAFYALLAGQRRLAEQEALLQLAQRAARAAADRFAAGAAPRLESLQAELGAVQANNETESARAVLVAARSDLDTLIGRPPGEAVVAAADLAAGEVPAAGAAIARALAGSSELALLDRRIAAQAAKVALARAQQVPNPTVQGAVTHDSPPDFVWGWRAGLAVTLPIFTRHHAAVEVEEATLAQLKGEREANVAQIAGSVTAAVAQAAAARDQALRYRDDILPRAAEVQELAQESYRAGETGLVALLQALQGTRDLRLRAVQAGLDYQAALADLEQALGAPLP